MADLDIQASDLRDRITLRSPTIAKTNDGAQVESYADVATNPTIWALWVNDHGQDSVVSEAEKSVQRATVTIRFRSDVLTTWQVVHNSKPWNIFSIDHVRGRNHWTVLRVEHVAGTI